MSQLDNRSQRLGLILSMLLHDKSATLAQVSQHLKVEERTLRNDFVLLSEIRVRRIRGGITLSDSFFWEKQRQARIDAKQEVATAAAQLFSPSTSIAASPGSTVALAYSALLEAGILPSVVTNSLHLTQYAATTGSPISLVGGEYHAHVHGLVGDDAVRGFAGKPCREGLLGVSGIQFSDGQCRLFVHHDPEVPVIRAMVNAVQEKLVIIADFHKLGQPDPWQIGNVEELTRIREDGVRSVVLVTNRIEDWKDEFISKKAYNDALETYNKLKALSSSLKALKFVSVPRGSGPDPIRKKGRQPAN